MSNPEWLRMIAGALLGALAVLFGIVFRAGGLWSQFKQHGKALDGLGGQTVNKALDGLKQTAEKDLNGLRQSVEKELNGLGQRVTRLEKDCRALWIALAMLCPPEKKDAIARMSKDDP